MINDHPRLTKDAGSSTILFPLRSKKRMFFHTGDTMREQDLATSLLITEMEFIELINRKFPKRSDIRYFLQAGMSRNGLLLFHWKFHYDLTLQIGWRAHHLRILQRLTVDEAEMPSSFPVTWNNFSARLPFDGNGEALLTGDMAHLLWNEVRPSNKEA